MMFFTKLKIFFFIASIANAEEIIKLQPNDLELIIRAKNQNISAARLMSEAAENRTGSLTRSFLPKVEAFGGVERLRTGPYAERTDPYYGVELKANLFRSGRDQLESRIRDEQVTGSKHFEKHVVSIELLEARKIFWELVFTRELVSILRDSFSQNEKNLVSANRRIARGVATKADRIEFEINGSEIKEEIETFEHEDMILEMKLAAVLGMPIHTQFETPTVLPHEHHEIEAQLKANSEMHQDVMLLRTDQYVSALHSSLSKRWWMPSLDFYSQYAVFTLRDRDYLSRSDRDEYVFGLRLTMNIFDGLSSSNSASTYALESEAYENKVQQKARSLEAGFRAAQEEMKHDHELIHALESRISQGKEYLSSTLDEYSRGVKNSPDVLNATQRLVGFRKRYAELRRDYQLSRAELLARLGRE